jgi:hypothetical protein
LQLQGEALIEADFSANDQFRISFGCKVAMSSTESSGESGFHKEGLAVSRRAPG